MIEGNPEGGPLPPAPPTSVPPAPPPSAMTNPNVPHVPLTPMMDFFSRRLESLELELTVEREKARSAAAQLQQQDALRGEVESHLKGMTEQLRREKAERDAEEMKSHARGRIDSLEKRLDEMHQSWAALLKDAVASRESGAASISGEQRALKTEISELTGAIGSLLEQIGAWRAESLTVSQSIPETSRQILAQFSTELRERLSSWQRSQELEAERQTERLRLLAAERETLQRVWEENNHSLRREHIQEREARENEIESRIDGLSKKFEDMLLSQQKISADSGRIRDDLAKAIANLNTPAKAKDQIMAGLTLERDDLLKALDDRARDLQRYLDERRHIEKTMGNALTALNIDLRAEREKATLASSRLTELEFENSKLKDAAALYDRGLSEREQRLAAMSAERDALAKSLFAESEKVRAFLGERELSEEAWRDKLARMEQRITAEVELRGKETTTVSELRAQLSSLTAHLSRAVSEKDAAADRSGDWENERQKLMTIIRQKDETISMLNATFQNMLKKE